MDAKEVADEQQEIQEKKQEDQKLDDEEV